MFKLNDLSDGLFYFILICFTKQMQQNCAKLKKWIIFKDTDAAYCLREFVEFNSMIPEIITCGKKLNDWFSWEL